MHVSLPSPTEPLQRVGFLAGAPALIRRFGVDPVKVLERAGLTTNALDDPESAIPYRAMGTLVELAAEMTRCAHFGLELGRHIHLSALGVLGRLMENAPTLRAALQDFAAHQHRNSHGGVVYLLEDGVEAVLGYAIHQPRIPGYNGICDGAAFAAFNVISDLIGGDRALQCKVLLSRAEPAYVAPYREAFKIPFSFNVGQTGVAFPRQFLSMPIPSSDPRLRRKLEEELLTTFRAGNLDLVTQVRRAVRVALMNGRVSAKEIAAQLDIKRWTLDRELNSHGLPFRKVVDEARCELVQQLLANTQLSIADVATIAGYTDPSTLTRSFIRWTSTTPSAWRTMSKERAS